MSENTTRVSLWDRDRDGGSLGHVEMLSRENRHTRSGDNWFDHAERMGWAIKVSGEMPHPWHRVMLTKVGVDALNARRGL